MNNPDLLVLPPTLYHKAPWISSEAERMTGRYTTHLRMPVWFNFSDKWLYLQNQVNNDWYLMEITLIQILTKKFKIPEFAHQL